MDHELVRFGILGPLEVTVGATPVSITGVRRRALLVRLILSANHVVATDTLIDQLWGEEPPLNPLNTLQAYLSHLRQVIAEPGSGGQSPGSSLVTQKPGYLLRVGPDRLDAAIFERLADEGARLLREGRPADALASLRSAQALWRGPALAEFADEAFASPEALRLEERRRGVVQDCFDAQLELGQHELIVAELQAAVVDQPLRERLWGQLMLALYRSGRQAEALRAYQDMRARLGGEMGLEPSPALRQLEQDILLQRPAADWRPSTILALALAGTEAGGAPPPLPPSLGRSRRFPFVGRQRELALLHDRWNAVAEDGQLRAVILSGEPGAGKTRLAAEFATEVHGAGAHVLFGAADEGPLMPYQPLAEAIGRYLDQLPRPDVESIRATHGGALTRIVPEFAVGASLPPPGDEDETERYRLFSAAESFLARQSAVASLLLVVDDLQWADEASLSLLRHVLRRCEVRAMIVATYRDTDIRADHPLHAWLADVQRNESVVQVRLGGLDAHEIGLLISTVSESLGDGSGREAAEVLERRTKGNAFFVCELLADGYRPDGGVPQTVRAAVVQRLAHLSDDVSRSLTVAAVLGREFDVRVVEQVAGMAAEPILLATEEAARAGIIDEQAGSEGTYQFAHGLFREVLYDALSGWRRRRLHAGVARCLEAMPAPQPTTRRRRVAELAYHFVEAGEAGDLAKAVGYAATAAEDALASLAYEEAARYYRMALSTGHADSRDGDLLLGLARAESGRGDVDAALAGVVAAADLARRSAAVEPLAEAALTLAQIRRSVKGDAVRDALLREAFAVLPESDSGLRVRLLVARQQVEDGDDRSAEALAMARRLRDLRVLAVALEGRLAALDRPEDGPERLGLSAELSEISDQLGDREKAFVAHLHRYWTQFEAAGWPRPAR